MLRITDSIIFQNFLQQIQDLNRDFARYNEQVVTGKRINRPSDDAVGFTQLTAINSEISRLNQFVENIDTANRRLQSSDARLNDVVLAMTRVIQLNEQAANGTTVGQPRKGIAAELLALTNEMLAHADAEVGGRRLFAGTRNTLTSLQQVIGNIEGRTYSVADVGVTDNGSSGSITGALVDNSAYDERIYQIRILDNAGSYEVVDLDGGDTVIASGTLAAPGDSFTVNGVEFTFSAGALAAGDEFTVVPRYAYNGTDSDIKMRVDESTTIVQNVKGSDPFGGTAPSAAGVQNPGGTLFDDLVEFRRALLTDDQAAIQTSLDTMNAQLDNLGQVRANAGGRSANLRTLVERSQSEIADLITNAADIENVNLAEAITKLTQTETGRQAALQAGARIGRLSLFDFIG